MIGKLQGALRVPIAGWIIALFIVFRRRAMGLCSHLVQLGRFSV